MSSPTSVPTSHAPRPGGHAFVPPIREHGPPAPGHAPETSGSDALWSSGASTTQAPDAAARAPASPLLDSPEARQALQVLQAGGLQAPDADTVRALAAQASGTPEHRALLTSSRDALTGRAPPPDAQAFGLALPAVLAPHATGRRFGQSNITAYVFLIMLQAQKEAMQEKRESLRALKMHAGMLEDLNAWVARVVIPAQRACNAAIKAGHLKDSLGKRAKAKAGSSRDDRIEQPIEVPDTIDTQWGAVDPASGRVFIPNLAQGAVTPKKLDAQELASLITQVDQWRATMQNNQNKQSMDFKRIDDAMSSTWNMLSAFLKSAQEGANAIIRNGLG